MLAIETSIRKNAIKNIDAYILANMNSSMHRAGKIFDASMLFVFSYRMDIKISMF